MHTPLSVCAGSHTHEVVVSGGAVADVVDDRHTPQPHAPLRRRRLDLMRDERRRRRFRELRLLARPSSFPSALPAAGPAADPRWLRRLRRCRSI